MKIINKSDENEMISLFLKAEINSNRFGNPILAILDRDGKERKIIDNPNHLNMEENRYRKNLLGQTRGYPNRLLFNGFPNDVKWKRALIKLDELETMKYIKENYWLELSGGSRLVRDAVENVKRGIEIFGQSNQQFWDAAEVVKSRKLFPEIILVGTSPKSDFIILEGHLRATAYLLVSESSPKNLEVIVGFSDNLTEWVFY